MIQVIKVADKFAGNQKAHDLLKPLVGSQTLLILSGGTSPDYKKMLVEPADILPGAVCLVDERYGASYHPGSHELMVKECGLLNFLQAKNITLHKILSSLPFEQTAQDYDRKLRGLFTRFETKIGIMGIGEDLHTAGIFPKSMAVDSHQLAVAQQVDDQFPKRITMTIAALSKFSTFIILVFGEEKKKTLAILFDGRIDDLNSYPAIFYRKTTIKSYLITDINF